MNMHRSDCILYAIERQILFERKIGQIMFQFDT